MVSAANKEQDTCFSLYRQASVNRHLCTHTVMHCRSLRVHRIINPLVQIANTRQPAQSRSALKRLHKRWLPPPIWLQSSHLRMADRTDITSSSSTDNAGKNPQGYKPSSRVFLTKLWWHLALQHHQFGILFHHTSGNSPLPLRGWHLKAHLFK